MTPAEILERRHDRFRLLTGGSRTAAGRHQTLRATVDWSYDLLDTGKKALFRRLSVFAGSWRMAAAEAVCGGADAGLDGPDLVLRLVDKSLVAVEGEVRSRYRLPETLRQYGLERLEEAAERAELERRHAEYFLALTMSDDWPTQTWWLDARLQVVAPELDNLRAALEWSRTQRPMSSSAWSSAWLHCGWRRDDLPKGQMRCKRPSIAVPSPPCSSCRRLSGSDGRQSNTAIFPPRRPPRRRCWG